MPLDDQPDGTSEAAAAAAPSNPSLLHGPDRPDLLRGEILAELFEATAERIPHRIAVESGDERLTYAELNQRADRAADRLIAAGVVPGRIAGLWLPRGIDLIVMQLAIAKTGAAWLPFDQQTPVERIAVCLDDADAVALVSSDAYAPAWKHQQDAPPADAPPRGVATPILTAQALLAEPDEADADRPLRRREGALPSHTAYVIYTSGSTGKPKGIAIAQGSITHFLRSENARLGVREGDRVYQGFSVAFDMSFEEIWISWLVGATLWLAPPEITGDPEALPRALVEHRIDVLHAVPTLLALFAQDVPNLRIINLGGEQCPQALVDRWARPGRQMFNTYGPTEATVSASLAELKSGEPVTIGEPLPNYGLLVIGVLDADAVAQSVREGRVPEMALLPQGEVGELCITGPGVAEGYLGRPDLTAEKFLPNPWARDAQEARLYRTGDLARVDEHGQVQCLGRADDQIKIRGFRVELGEIEAVLAQQPGVGTTAVVLRKDDDIDRLVAFIVPAEGSAPPAVAALRQALGERLPPYMVPAHFEMMESMPRLPSGKIDRKPLRAMPLAAPQAVEGASDEPRTDAERVLFAALARLFPGQPIRRDADFFADLGGHSLMAARLISALRAEPAYAQATVREVYQHRRIGALAQALEAAAAATAPAGGRRTDFLEHSAWRRWRCGIAQAAAIPLLVTLKMAQWLAPFFAYHFHTGDPTDSLPRAIGLSLLAFIAATMAEFVVVWLGRWAVAGRLKPGRYPLWGLTYYRWWLADRLMDAVPTYMLSGSSMYRVWLRMLGAKVGDEVLLGSVAVRVPELLTLGDGVSVGNAVTFENARVEGGWLHLGRIDVEAEACIGSYSVIEGNTRIGRFGHLEGQSVLTDGQQLPAGRIWGGSPSRDMGEFDLAGRRPRPTASLAWRAWEWLVFASGSLLVAVLFFMPVFPTFILIDKLDIDDLAVRPLIEAGVINPTQAFVLRLVKFFVLALPASAVLVASTMLVAAGIRWVFLPRTLPGATPVHSGRYLAKWMVNQIQEASLSVLHGIYATVFSSSWYRMLGAKVGKEAELSTALGVVPDMLTLGDECFIADAVMLGDEEIDGGWMTVHPTVVERRSFVGNFAYVPDGSRIPSDVLIGVMSALPRDLPMQPGQTWLGSPPIELPAREVVTGHPDRLTFAPSWRRRVGRGIVEAFRIAAPHALVIAAGYAIVLDAMPLADAERWGAVAMKLFWAGLAFGLATYLFVLAFKWIAIGRYKRTAVPMWTPFVWLSEATTNMYEGITVPNMLNYLRGTPWLPLAMNLLGARIAPSVWLNTTDITEFDNVVIGPHSELNALCCPQTHLFEDRVMKVDDVIIGSRVTVGARSVVLYGAQVGDDVVLGPMTLVMKGEGVPAGTRWHGIPAEPMRAV